MNTVNKDSIGEEDAGVPQAGPSNDAFAEQNASPETSDAGKDDDPVADLDQDTSQYADAEQQAKEQHWGSERKAGAEHIRHSEPSEDNVDLRYFEILSGNRADAAEGKLHDILLNEAGDVLRKSLVEVFAQPGVMEPGLRFVEAPSPFGYVWALRHSLTPKDAKYVRVGHQTMGSRPDQLTRIVERYRMSDVLGVIVDESSYKNRLFWQKNRNLSVVDEAAKQASLALVVLISPQLKRKLDRDADLLDQIAEFQEKLVPSAEEALYRLLETNGAPGVSDLAKNAALTTANDAFQSAFNMLREGNTEALKTLLKTEGLSGLETSRQQKFRNAAVNLNSRDPAAATALFLGANFHALPSRLFERIWVILHACIEEYWPEPVMREQSEDNPRPWRDYGSDEALSEIGLRMKRSSDGTRRAEFSSQGEAQRYAELLAEHAPNVDNVLFECLFGIVRPLNYGHEVIEPAAKLFARHLQDTLGRNSDPDGIARSFFNVICEHRQSADEAIAATQRERHLLETAHGSVLSVIRAELAALERLRSAEHLVDTVPSFVVRSLQEYYEVEAAGAQLSVVQALWKISLKEFRDEDERIIDFWRQIITGMSYGIDPMGATGFLANLFDCDPNAFFTLGPGASRGLSVTVLPASIEAAADTYSAERGAARAWTFGGVAALVTYWMHLGANSEASTGAALTAPELINAVAKILLSREGVKCLKGLSDLTRELAARPGAKEELAPIREGTLSRSLLFSQLRLLYGLSGGEFDRLTREIDARPGGFRTAQRWSASSGAHFPEFDRWRRLSAGSAGAAIIASEAILSGADVSERIAKICNAAPDEQEAAAILKDSSDFLRQDLRRVAKAINPDKRRQEDFRRLDNTLRTLRDASKRRMD